MKYKPAYKDWKSVPLHQEEQWEVLINQDNCHKHWRSFFRTFEIFCLLRRITAHTHHWSTPTPEKEKQEVTVWILFSGFRLLWRKASVEISGLHLSNLGAPRLLKTPKIRTKSPEDFFSKKILFLSTIYHFIIGSNFTRRDTGKISSPRKSWS
jgi:hypothetical protein